jgi:L-alanine-DL-glutamate epimerase-like enolase superfamily enzyme
MKIESVDFFYLAMPEIHAIGDGSQDALLVRLRTDSQEGWGECEASPLVTMAAWNCPMSHSACKPLSASILGQPLRDVRDIRRIHERVGEQSLDLLQSDHLLSGIDIAMWDLLGKQLETPIYRLLGFDRSFAKLPYASGLFGETPQETLEKARDMGGSGFRAAKFGWGPYGRGTVDEDREQVHAAREGLGKDATLLIDAGTVWGDDLALARQRLPALKEARVAWLEEPFISAALGAYRELSSLSHPLSLAGGEGCHQSHQAYNMIDFGKLGYIQIDTGRIGGITSAFQVAQYARERGVAYVNHTFTSHLALSASIQPYAGHAEDQLCEYPVEATPLARELTRTSIRLDGDGMVCLPEAPGLGLEPDLEIIRRYKREVEIRVDGNLVQQTGTL